MRVALCGGLYFLLSLAVLPEAMAQQYAVGDRLTPQQLAQATRSTPLRVGEQAMWEIGSQSLVTMSLAGAVSSGPVSMVVNEQGQVGESRNEVVVALVPPAELLQRLQPMVKHAVSVQYDIPRSMTVLRFNSLPSAVRVRNSVMRLWPHARVVVPVQYGT